MTFILFSQLFSCTNTTATNFPQYLTIFSLPIQTFIPIPRADHRTTTWKTQELPWHKNLSNTMALTSGILYPTPLNYVILSTNSRNTLNTQF